MQRAVFFIIFFIFLCSSSNAEVYKWVDENGKVQFSDKAPAEKNAENIEKELQKTNVDSASAKMGSGIAPKSEKTEDEKLLEQQRLQRLEDAIGKNCKKMKSDIEAMARGERGSFIDKNGKEELVLERDMGKKLEEWKEAYRKYGCEKLYPLG